MMPVWLSSLATVGISLGLPVEADWVGPRLGVRPEILFHPGGRVNGGRLAVGVLASDRDVVVPISLGWRARTGPLAEGHALFGLGGEVRLGGGVAPAAYAEVGAAWSVRSRWDLALVVSPSVAWAGGAPALDGAVRLGVVFR